MPVDRWQRSLPMAIDEHNVTVADSTGGQPHFHFALLRLGNGQLLDREWLANLTTHRCFQFLFLTDAVAERLSRHYPRQGSGQTCDWSPHPAKYTTRVLCLRKGCSRREVRRVVYAHSCECLLSDICQRPHRGRFVIRLRRIGNTTAHANQVGATQHTSEEDANVYP
jgi:hypothetical protein